MDDVYAATWRSDKPHGLPEARIETAVFETVTGRRLLSAKLVVTADAANGASAQISIPLDAGTMRAMANLLTEHATRIAVELLPLIHQAQPDPETIAFADWHRAGREAA